MAGTYEEELHRSPRVSLRPPVPTRRTSAGARAVRAHRCRGRMRYTHRFADWLVKLGRSPSRKASKPRSAIRWVAKEARRLFRVGRSGSRRSSSISAATRRIRIQARVLTSSAHTTATGSHRSRPGSPSSPSVSGEGRGVDHQLPRRNPGLGVREHRGPSVPRWAEAFFDDESAELDPLRWRVGRSVVNPGQSDDTAGRGPALPFRVGERARTLDVLPHCM